MKTKLLKKLRREACLAFPYSPLMPWICYQRVKWQRQDYIYNRVKELRKQHSYDNRTH